MSMHGDCMKVISIYVLSRRYIFTNLSWMINFASGGVSAVNYASCFKINLNKHSRLTLSNRCLAPIIWQTHRCMSVRRRPPDRSCTPVRRRRRRRRQLREKKLTAGMSLACPHLHDSTRISILFCKRPTPNHFHLIFYQSHFWKSVTTVYTAPGVIQSN